ncbi:heavy-metal-associated domain-containing protein [Flavobacterium sandaracinum]|uniref:Heavy-metal-associated domain-containing protein n=1 Tax=Flavobacterium sandaracinum TaxID=2541733 RepID=A0A4R5CZF2_9FLAO|nr:heavy-metal-associated domain-containing protein [Flavobacterium sandaracinum]TDE05267.1 heavy-metal-associated domain-containing protein [Flavobacterium sandaracinum]
MKNIHLKFIAITCLLLITSIKSYSQISKAELIATGLTCSMCSNAINKQLKATVGVDSVSTDLNTNTFTVYFKKDSKISPRILKEGVEKAGFFIGSMVLTINLGDVQIKQNLKVEQNSGTYVFVAGSDKPMNGSVEVKVLNDGYVTKKEFKKLAKVLEKYNEFSSQENTYLVKTI